MKKLVAILLVVSFVIFAVPFSSSALNGTAEYTPAESNISGKYWVSAEADSGDAAAAIDGDSATAWVPISLPAALTVDLGGTYDAVRKVKVIFADSLSVNKYKLEGSNDGQTWTVLSDRSANTIAGGIFTDIFAFEGLRYVRLTLTAGGAGVGELQVINYLRKDMDNGSDVSGFTTTDTYYYNVNNDPPAPDGIRGGSLTPDSMETGNNFFGLTKDMGWDTIRMRIWNEPRSEGSDSKTAAIGNDQNVTTNCSPASTLTQAKYIAGAGQNVAIDFHYSDSWSDPQNQPKPYAWAELPFDELIEATHDFTYDMIKDLIDQGTTPTIVALGNEITNGMMWGSEYELVNPYAHFHSYWRRYLRDNPDAPEGGGVKWVKYEEAGGNKNSPEYAEFMDSVENLALLVDAGNRAIQELNEEYDLNILTEMHFAFNVFEQPSTGKVAMDPDEVFEKVTTLVGGLADSLTAKAGMVDRIGVSYYPDWHGTYDQVQRNVVELSKMLPGVLFNIAECSPKASGTVTDWMADPNHIPEGSPDGTSFRYTVQSQGDDGIDIMKTINDVPNNVGQGVWPWNGSSVYQVRPGGGRTGPATLQASFKSWNDAFAKNVLESDFGFVTKIGTPITLPATIKSLDVATGAITNVPVVWDSFDNSVFTNGGSITVSGTADVTVPEEGRGKEMTAVTATLKVLTRVEESDKNLTFSSGWGLRAQIGKFSGHLAKQASKVGESMSFTFEGDSFAVIGYRSYSQGMFDIYVDGVKSGETVDLYQPVVDSSFQQTVASRDVPYGVHTVTLVVTGRNERSIGSNVYVDAIDLGGKFVQSSQLVDDQVIVQSGDPIEIDVLANDLVTGDVSIDTPPASGDVQVVNNKITFTPTEMSVKDDSFTYKVGNATATVKLVYADTIRYEETFQTVVKNGSWQTFGLDAFSGKSALRSSVKDDTITVKFYGTGIDIIGYKSWSRGIVDITVGGVTTPVDTFDMTYDQTYGESIYSVSGLAQGVEHTLTIRVTGDRFFLASGNAIDIDAFVVHK
ncbi:MAG TPA: hypothetical protein DEQ02_07085 [Ruminococcaceae bacterium]|nr:hypothetical protein [Oscillospiraceae bacterium]